jgi:amidase
MPASPPNIEQLRKIANGYNLHLDEAELEAYHALVETVITTDYQQIEQLPEIEPPPVKYPRTSGYRPAPEENPLSAWYWKCSVKGADSGPLAGKRIAMKDNICVAGIPMMNGSATVEGYTPEFDATVVTRILDAGGEIVGKAVCEDLCFSGGSHTSHTGPVLNPHDHSRMAGGSSSGSGAVVAAGDCDIAMGGDQGGSIRVPSAWCGIYGLKQTYGLVPYTGVFPIELTLDHTGPMATNVTDIALTLEAIAGEDGLDPRQPIGVQGGRYSEALSDNLEGVRIAALAEGFGWPEFSEEDVDQTVRDSIRILGDLGAEIVDDVSVPLHRYGINLWDVIGAEGALRLMIQGNSMGTNWLGYYNQSQMEVYGRGLKTHADDLSVTAKTAILYGHYMQEHYNGRYYAKAQNIRLKIRQAFERAFEQVDLLVMPTTPMKPMEIPEEPNAPQPENVTAALNNLVNTNTFDLTHHPALTLPCGRSEGLPIGMMLVGRHFDEATLLRAAYAFEQTGTYGDVRVGQAAAAS